MLSEPLEVESKPNDFAATMVKTNEKFQADKYYFKAIYTWLLSISVLSKQGTN
jgi:hypothetical protein